MPTTITCSIGSRSADNVTVNSVSGTTPGPYTVTLSAAVPATTKVGDTITDSAANIFLIEGISGSDLTVYKRHFGSASDPATGAGTTQRAYSMPDDWAAAAPADLTTADQVWKGEMWNDATFSFTSSGHLVSMGGVTDATRYYHLTTGAGQSYTDHANKATNALRPNQSNGVLISVHSSSYGSGGIFGVGSSNNYKTIIEKIQILDNRGSEPIIYANIGNTTALGLWLYNILYKGGGAATGGNGTFYLRAGRVVNSAFICSSNTACLVNAQSGNPVRMSGVTAVHTSGASSQAAFRNFSSSITCIGCATFGWGVDNDSVNASSSNNATDRANFATNSTSDQESLTAADELESVTAGSEDLRLKSTNTIATDCIRDQTYTSDLDIVGQSRSTTTPSIGAWEVVAGGASAEGGGMLLGSRRNRLTIP